MNEAFFLNKFEEEVENEPPRCRIHVSTFLNQHEEPSEYHLHCSPRASKCLAVAPTSMMLVECAHCEMQHANWTPIGGHPTLLAH